MERAAVSQSVRNWKFLSDLKEKASSVYIKGEEVLADLSIFSRQNMYAKEKELPAYERLINRISFKNQRKPLRLKTRFSSLQKIDDSEKTVQQNSRQDQSKLRDLIIYFLSIF